MKRARPCRLFLCASLAGLAGALLGLAGARGEGGATASNLFPFSLPNEEHTEGIADLAFLNAGPANKLVSVRDGHFFAGGKPIRFWGVCVIGTAAFPAHAEAPVIARRLAGRGFNQVRIHLIDGSYAPNGLFDPAHKGELRMLPEQLDKLDFFIAELKKCGIYVELPVHGYHWRNITASADYPGVDFSKFAPFSSGVPLWNEHFIATEKQFARDFFGHVNPYTGKAYTEEPCVSTLEIINENGLICAWRGGHFRKVWPAAMLAELQARWNQFLKTRYATSARLQEVWAVGETHVDTRELLKSGTLAGDAKPWYLQCVKPSSAALKFAAGGGPDGRPYAVLSGERAAASPAFVILQQAGLAIEKGARYKLSFFARAEVATNATLRLGTGISLDHAPWHSVGSLGGVEVGPAWREVTQYFVGTHDEKAAKLMLTPSTGPFTLSLAGVSLRKVDIVGLPAGESLEAGSIAMPLMPEDGVRRTRPVGADFVDFLYELDAHYFDTMRDFLKRELRCRHPIKGTQVDNYSSYFSQARCDYLDAHGYWEHPHFPRKPWDQQDWTVGNSPMINHGAAVVVDLAGRRVRGQPFNISEYCHPAPSTFCAEQMPTISALGALQDWDGIIFHCWQEQGYDWHVRGVRPLAFDRIDGWFNIARHPVKLVTLPFGALAFRRGDVAVAQGETTIGFTLDEEKRWLAEKSGTTWRAFDVAAGRGATWLTAFTQRINLVPGPSSTPAFTVPDRRRAQSDTGEIDYDRSDAAASVLTINAPRAKAVVGFGAGKTYVLGDVVLQPGPTLQRGFSVITASAVRGHDFHSPGARLLVTATGYVENQGMGWNAEKTSVGKNWGAGPVVCEGIPFAMTLKTKQAKAWALDPHGRRGAALAGIATAGGIQFVFGPEQRTLWYEIEIE